MFACNEEQRMHLDQTEISDFIHQTWKQSVLTKEIRGASYARVSENNMRKDPTLPKQRFIRVRSPSTWSKKDCSLRSKQQIPKQIAAMLLRNKNDRSHAHQQITRLIAISQQVTPRKLENLVAGSFNGYSMNPKPLVVGKKNRQRLSTIPPRFRVSR